VSINKNIFQSKKENKNILNKIFENSLEISHSTFINFALYDRGFGFYSNKKRMLLADFITSPLTHKSFGIMIAKQIIQIWDYYKNPKYFSIIELGGSSGKLKEAIISYMKKHNKKIYRSLVYLNIDEANNDSLLDVNFNSKYGCIISNEFFDALPFDRFQKKNKALKEIFIKKDSENNLVEVLKDSEKINIFDNNFISKIPENSRIELTNNLKEICNKISSFLDHCIMLTIDYGFEDLEKLLINNPNGHIRCFSGHNMDKDILSNIGNKDITCDVNFYFLNYFLEDTGFKKLGFCLQEKFLQNMGIANYFNSIKDPIEKQQIVSLMNPNGLGGFKVYFHQFSSEGFWPLGLNQ
jgi:SAM-dependent MidA family methyltransferase